MPGATSHAAGCVRRSKYPCSWAGHVIPEQLTLTEICSLVAAAEALSRLVFKLARIRML